MLPGRVALSPAGALGLLVFVPWTIGWYFPGEGRVPLLISVSGVLIIGVAVLMARLSHRFGTELGHRPGPGRPGVPTNGWLRIMKQVAGGRSCGLRRTALDPNPVGSPD